IRILSFCRQLELHSTEQLHIKLSNVRAGLHAESRNSCRQNQARKIVVVITINPFLYSIMSGEKESTQGGIAAAPAMWQNGEKSRREVRLGVVMYGGVSLAVYINGVAHEFFRAVRG